MSTSTDIPASSTVDASATWYAGYAGRYAWQFPPKPPVPPARPKCGRSRCWRCGRFAPRPSPGITRRRCDRCDVTWQGHGTVKFVDTVTDAMHAARDRADEAWGRQYFMGASLRALPGEIKWDQFDEFIDHSRVSIPSPA